MQSVYEKLQKKIENHEFNGDAISSWKVTKK